MWAVCWWEQEEFSSTVLQALQDGGGTSATKLGAHSWALLAAATGAAVRCNAPCVVQVKSVVTIRCVSSLRLGFVYGTAG